MRDKGKRQERLSNEKGGGKVKKARERGGEGVEGREKEGRGKGYGGEREGRVQERVGREKMWGENEKIQEIRDKEGRVEKGKR